MRSSDGDTEHPGLSEVTTTAVTAYGAIPCGYQRGAALIYGMEEEQKDIRLGVSSCPATPSRARLALKPTVARVPQQQLERTFFNVKSLLLLCRSQIQIEAEVRGNSPTTTL